MDKASTQCLESLRPPSTIAELRNILGVCNVFRRFILRPTDIASALNGLLEGIPPEELPITGTQRSAFKIARSSEVWCDDPPPLLSIAQNGFLCEIDTDAFEHQVGFTLFQYQEVERKPIGFWSRTLNPNENNYHMTEK